jgi:ribonuclease HI
MSKTYYTDGACIFNGNPLSLGVSGCLCVDTRQLVISKPIYHSNSSEMEVEGLLLALQQVNCNSTIYCDCESAIRIVSGNSHKCRTVLEYTARQLYRELSKQFSIEIKWVKAHSTNEFNCKIDLALESALLTALQADNFKAKQLKQEATNLYNKKGCFENFSQNFFTSL